MNTFQRARKIVFQINKIWYLSINVSKLSIRLTYLIRFKWQILLQIQSQKTQDFATLSDERRSRSKIFLLFIWIKEPCVRKFEGLARSKLLGISQTEIQILLVLSCPRNIRINPNFVEYVVFLLLHSFI